MSVREAAAAAARLRVVLAVSLRVHGRDLVDEGRDAGEIATLLASTLDGAQQEWLEDLVQMAGYRAGVEADPVVYGDQHLPLMTESEVRGMIDDLVEKSFDDQDAPAVAFPSSHRM